MAATISRTDSRRIAAQRRRYLAAQPPSVRRVLIRIHAAIRHAVPGAEETFSYGIPGFRFRGRALLWYAGWAKHVSVYPMTGWMKKTLARQIEGLVLSKGTVRFPLDEPVPIGLVARLAKARAAEIRSPVKPSRDHE